MFVNGQSGGYSDKSAPVCFLFNFFLGADAIYAVVPTSIVLSVRRRSNLSYVRTVANSWWGISSGP